MASEASSSYREQTHTRDRVILQDYGQFLNSTTTSVVLPTPKKEGTKADRLQATYDLFQAVNWAKYTGDFLVNAIVVDFSSVGGSSRLAISLASKWQSIP